MSDSNGRRLALADASFGQQLRAIAKVAIPRSVSAFDPDAEPDLLQRTREAAAVNLSASRWEWRSDEQLDTFCMRRGPP